jgi:hypothetical protein
MKAIVAIAKIALRISAVRLFNVVVPRFASRAR